MVLVLSLPFDAFGLQQATWPSSCYRTEDILYSCIVCKQSLSVSVLQFLSKLYSLKHIPSSKEGSTMCSNLLFPVCYDNHSFCLLIYGALRNFSECVFKGYNWYIASLKDDVLIAICYIWHILVLVAYHLYWQIFSSSNTYYGNYGNSVLPSKPHDTFQINAQKYVVLTVLFTKVKF